MTMQGASRPSSLADTGAQHLVIRNDSIEAIFYPAVGGRMGRLRHVSHGDLIVPFTPDTFDRSVWPKSGAFPLFPFHNMARNATFEHYGQLIRLRPNMADGTNVMHGPAHRRAWSVSDHAAHHIKLTLDYTADEDWPFAFRATQRFELRQNRLTIALGLTNTGQDVMPGGLGWHPYFQASKDGEIGLNATHQWNPFGPTGPSRPIHDGTIAPQTRLELGSTQHFSGWKQASTVIADSARITLHGQGALTCLAALHKEAYLCLEPVSHVAGALETPDTATDTGLRYLTPGESMYGTAILTVA